MPLSSSTLSRLVQWWNAQGPPRNGASTSATIQPQPSPLGGNGLFLVADVASTTPQHIATIPSDLLLTASTIHRYAQVHDRPLARALDHLTPPDSPYPPSRLAILTFLIRFRALSDTQDNQINLWRPYLLALPTLADLHVPTQYEDQELALLHGTAMPRLVSAKRAKLVDELELILSAFDHAPVSPSSESVPAPSTTSTTMDMRKLVDLEDLIWADAVFWSRVLEVPAISRDGAFELAMIPILDFANHSFDHPTLRWDRDLTTGDIHLSLTSSTAKPGDELFLCYDPDKSNEQLLFTHGFVIADNSRGFISVDAMPELNMLAAQAPELAHRIQWAVDHLKVRPMVLVSADGAAQQGQVTRIEWLGSVLERTSLALVLMVAVDEVGAAEAIQSAAMSATAGDKEPYAQMLFRVLAVLKDRVGASPDAVDRASEFLHVVFSRVMQELDEINAGKVVVRDEKTVAIQIEGIGEDGEKAMVEHELAQTRFEAIVGYKEQVKRVIAGVVKATASK